jgi:hypothetical protein
VFFCIFAGYPILFFFENPNMGGKSISKKMGSMFLEIKLEKVKQLIYQKGKGYLSYGEIDDLVPLNNVFPKDR